MFRLYPEGEVARCRLCGTLSPQISKALQLCKQCIRDRGNEALPLIKDVHRNVRRRFALPSEVPTSGDAKCNLCINECRIPEGQKGYCGLRENLNGRLRHIAGTKEKARVEWYYDSLPTNCVGEWCCAGGSGAGYPRYSYSKTAEYGYKNLAVFYGACSFNCLFCQNWHFRKSRKEMSASELASKVDERTACICYFGGDPTPQLAHAIAVSRIVLEENENRILRICFETNGSMSRGLLRKVAELSLESGGCIKFDLKAFDENLNIALCGVTNKRTLENFEWLGQFVKERKDPPLLIASTLLVPGYIDSDEVKSIAEFIASVDSSIPYSLLAFHPDFLMRDMPVSSREQAVSCYDEARKVLKNVRIGNVHLLA